MTEFKAGDRMYYKPILSRKPRGNVTIKDVKTTGVKLTNDVFVRWNNINTIDGIHTGDYYTNNTQEYKNHVQDIINSDENIHAILTGTMSVVEMKYLRNHFEEVYQEVYIRELRERQYE